MARGSNFRHAADGFGKTRTRGLRGVGHTRLLGYGVRRAEVRRDRWRTSRSERRTPLRRAASVTAGAPGSVGGSRHGVQLVAGGDSPGLPGTALGRVRHGAGGWRQRAADPATMITFSSAHMLAPDGRCKTFDAAAAGYVRGEGCGIIVIKRLEDALADGDTSGRDSRECDQPGRRVGRLDGAEWRWPNNGSSPMRSSAPELEPRDVGYLEAHGTGRRSATRSRPRRPEPCSALAARRPAAVDRIGEDEHRTPRGSRGNRRRHQGHPVPRARNLAQALQFREPLTAHSVGPPCRRGRPRDHPVDAGDRPRSQASALSASQAPTRTSSSKRRPRHPRCPLPTRPTNQQTVSASFRSRPHTRRLDAARRSLPPVADCASRGQPCRRLHHRGHGAGTPGTPGRPGGRLQRIRPSSSSAHSPTTARLRDWSRGIS